MSNFHGGSFGNPRQVFSCTKRARAKQRERERAKGRTDGWTGHRGSLSPNLLNAPRLQSNRLSIFDRESSRLDILDNLYLNTNANKIIGFARNLFIS